MSNELVKYEALEKRIQRWREGARPMPPPDTTPPIKAPRESRATVTWAVPDNLPTLGPDATEFELPRICAREKKLWTALYIRRPDERFLTYLRSNVGESWRLMRYAPPEAWRAAPPNLVLGIELCPHCGAYTRDGAVGSIYCDRCGMYCCYGLTSAHGYSVCACKREGQLVNGSFPQAGFR